MWSRSRGIDTIWTNILYNILRNEWELKVVYRQYFFWLRCFHRALLLMYFKSSGQNYANNCKEKLFHTNKCKCMSLNVGIELPIYEGNGLAQFQIQVLKLL